ncbi:putative cytoplasmic protein [Vibrio mimicus VM223]|nr:putative cytoplasmic protein [Vibrio mimicus VM223]
MQAVMLYQSKHNTEADHMSVGVGGEVVFKSKAELKKRFTAGEEDILRVNPNQEA